jgi:hypothetical protein
MVPEALTRRAALAGAAALLTGLAGCETDTSPDDPTPSSGTRTDPAHVMLRNPAGEPVVSVPPDEDPLETGTQTPERPVHGFVASSDDLEALSFADVEGVERAREFLATTSFDAETVFYEQGRVAECRRRTLCYVSWTPGSIETDYADVLRPATVECSTDADDALTTFIRIPEALDPDRISSYSSGHSRGAGGCRTPDRARRAERTTARTNASDAAEGQR